jgi:hypothetical protein
MELTHEEHQQLQHALQGDWDIPDQLADRFELHLRHCHDCQRLLKTSGQLKEKIKKAFQSSAHLSQSQLLFHLTARALGDDLPAADRVMLDRHRAHLQSCPLCRMREDYLRKELAHCEEVVFETAEDFATTREPALEAKTASRGRFGFTLARLAFGVGGAVVACLIAFAVNLKSLPDYYHYTNPHSDSYSSSLKLYRQSFEDLAGALGDSSVQGQLWRAHEALRAEDSQKALEVLLSLDEQDLEGEDLLRLRLYELMATLKDAHSDYIRLFPRFDTTRVAAALAEMKVVLPKDPLRAGQLDRDYAGPAYYYAAKACLILGRREAALEYIGLCLALPNHRRKTETENLLQEIDRP